MTWYEIIGLILGSQAFLKTVEYILNYRREKTSLLKEEIDAVIKYKDSIIEERNVFINKMIEEFDQIRANFRIENEKLSKENNRRINELEDFHQETKRSLISDYEKLKKACEETESKLKKEIEELRKIIKEGWSTLKL